MADIKKVVDIEVKSNVDETTKSVNKLDKSLKNTSEASTEIKSQLNTISGGRLSALTGIIGKVRLAFVSLRTAIIASGIGALALAVVAVGRAFKDSEEGQNKFAKLMGIIGAVVGNLTDLLADLGEKIISAFENPKEAIKSFSELIKTNISNRFEGLIELIPALGNAINLLFKGEFVQAGKVAGDAVAKITLGVENFTDKVKGATEAVIEFGKEQVREGNQAAKVADMRAKAEIEERKLLIERATLENKIAQLKLKSREEDRFGAEERKQALIDAQKLEDTLLEKETKVLKLRADAQTLENTFSRSNKENLNEEARLQAEVIRQQAARTNAQRQTQRELNRLNKEISADNKRVLAEEQKAIDDLEKFKKDLADKNEDERIEKIQKEKEDRLIKLEELKLEGEEENALKLEIEQRYLDDLNAIKEEDRLIQQAEDEKNAEEEAKKAKERADELVRIEQAKADAEQAIKNANLDAIGTGFKILASMNKKNKGLQKASLIGENAVGIAKNIINTNAANARLTLEGGLIGAAPAIAANNIRMATGIASSIAATAQGLSAIGGGGSARSTSGGSYGSGAVPLPTSFDTVNQSQAQNGNLANQITNNASEQPVQAYVTSTDVASANALERNRITDASF